MIFMLYIPAFGFFADFGKSFIQTVLFDQFRVGAAFRDFSVVYHENIVRVLNGCKAVGNLDNRFAFRKFDNSRLDKVFVFGVDACGRFVENDDGRIFKYGALDGYTLFFPAGKRNAVFRIPA